MYQYQVVEKFLFDPPYNGDTTAWTQPQPPVQGAKLVTSLLFNNGNTLKEFWELPPQQ
jgi:hypothetical protein